MGYITKSAYTWVPEMGYTISQCILGFLAWFIKTVGAYPRISEMVICIAEIEMHYKLVGAYSWLPEMGQKISWCVYRVS